MRDGVTVKGRNPSTNSRRAGSGRDLPNTVEEPVKKSKLSENVTIDDESSFIASTSVLSSSELSEVDISNLYDNQVIDHDGSKGYI